MEKGVILKVISILQVILVETSSYVPRLSIISWIL